MRHTRRWGTHHCPSPGHLKMSEQHWQGAYKTFQHFYLSSGLTNASTMSDLPLRGLWKPRYCQNRNFRPHFQHFHPEIFYFLSQVLHQHRWLGAKTLFNAGFKLVGTVAPLIAMDGTRYKTETQLVQILDEKHTDNPENLSITRRLRALFHHVNGSGARLFK